MSAAYKNFNKTELLITIVVIVCSLAIMLLIVHDVVSNPEAFGRFFGRIANGFMDAIK